MQLFALDNGSLIFANHAAKQKNYCCFECNGTIRLRKGPHRQPHFYHLQPSQDCRLNGKGMVHLQVQIHLFNSLPEGECVLEHRFPSIQRIADVAWISRKIVFEIQYSSITAEEISQRNADYQQIGWQVIWIFHDHRYNRSRVSAAEAVLFNQTHYFTNINQDGLGIIYDQLSLVEQGIRKYSIRSPAVDLACCQPVEERYGLLPTLLQARLNAWPYCFQGDLIDRFAHSLGLEELAHFNQMADTAAPCQPSRWKTFLAQAIIRPYRLLFQLLLEKQCR